MNRDSDNAQPTSSTFRQIVTGPRGGLSIELSAALEDFPWLNEDAENGFKVYIDPTPFAALLSPLTAPHAAETFIKVAPSLHSLAADCASPGRLSRMKHPQLVYHDPEGYGCSIEHFAEHILAHGGCYSPGYTFKPNTSVVCTPTFLAALSKVISFDNSRARKSVIKDMHKEGGTFYSVVSSFQ